MELEPIRIDETEASQQGTYREHKKLSSALHVANNNKKQSRQVYDGDAPIGKKSKKPSEQRTACAIIFFSTRLKVAEPDPLPDTGVESGETVRVLLKSSVNVPADECFLMLASGSEDAGRVLDMAQIWLTLGLESLGTVNVIVVELPVS